MKYITLVFVSLSALAFFNVTAHANSFGDDPHPFRKMRVIAQEAAPAAACPHHMAQAATCTRHKEGEKACPRTAPARTSTGDSQGFTQEDMARRCPEHPDHC